MISRYCIVSLLAVAPALASGCARAPVAPVEATPRIATARASIEEIAVTVPAVGRVGPAAGSQTKLAFATAGRIASVSVHVGDRVNAGDSLASLDAVPLALAEQAASADAQAAGVDRTSTRLAVDAAAVSRAHRLFAAGVVARKDVEAAQEQLAADQADTQIARAGAAGANARAALAARDLQNAQLRSPIAGIVTAVYHFPGESVDSTVAVIAVTPVAPGEVSLQVSGSDAERVKAGNPVRLRVGSTAFEGSVLGVAGAVDPTTQNAQVIVRASIPGALSGVSVDAQIVVAHDLGIVLPKSAVVADPSTGKTLVFVAGKDKDGRVSWDSRVVTVVFQNERDAEVTGLRPGEVVAAAGGFELLPPSGN